MYRILLITGPDRGEVNPMVGVAQQLRRMGHTVGWLCVPAPTPQLEKLGVELVACDLPNAPPPTETDRAALVSSAPALRAWLKERLIDRVPDQVEPILRSIRAWRAEAIALDPTLYAAIFAARQENVPYLAVSTSMNPVVHPTVDCALARALRSLRALRYALFASEGMKPTFGLTDCLSPHGTTVFATRGLLPTRATVPDQVELVGPSLPSRRRGDEPADFPATRLRGRTPLVYVSFGAFYPEQPELFDLLIRSLEPLAVRLLLSVGDLIDTRWATALPENVQAVRYAPQLEVLTKASVFIGHAGFASVMEGLASGCPMLTLPIWNDQPLVADFLRRTGAALVIERDRASNNAIREAVRALLSPAPATAATIARHKEAARTIDGAKTVAKRLVTLAEV